MKKFVIALYKQNRELVNECTYDVAPAQEEVDRVLSVFGSADYAVIEEREDRTPAETPAV